MKIFVKAKVGAKEEKMKALSQTHFEIWVKEKPIKGRANKAIVEILADHFSISPSRVTLAGGISSKTKVFDVI